MTIVDPEEIGCAHCRARPGEPCRTGSGRRTRPHALRWAEARRPGTRPGDVPEIPIAPVLDLDAARLRKLARDNGARLP